MLPVNLNHFSIEPQKQKTPKLTAKKLKVIEESDIFSVTERIELLLLFLNIKWVAELDIELRNRAAYVSELKLLGLPWALNAYEGEYKCQWIQVGRNRAVLDYVMQHKDALTELEAGVLYGYPLTHVLGFVGILKSYRTPPLDVATYFLAGIYSEEFYKQEVAAFNAMWKGVEEVSPSIANQAREYYLQNKPKTKK